MATASYQIVLNDSSGARLAKPFLGKQDYISLEYARSTNSGSDILTLTLPGTYDYTQLLPDSEIEIWRRPANGPRKLDLETKWLVRYIMPSFDNTGQRLILVKAESLVSLLRRRIVAYADGTAQSGKSMAADDLLKQVVSENFGASAGSGRDWSVAPWYMTVAASTAQAPVITKTFAYMPVSQVCKEVAATVTQGDPVNNVTATYLYYDVVPVPSNLPGVPDGVQFRTYVGQRGINHGAASASPVTFSAKAGNITSGSREWDYLTEETVIYAGGPGQGDQRAITTATSTPGINRSRWGRIEGFTNANNATVPGPIIGVVDPVKMAAEANAALMAKRARRRMVMTVSDTDQTQRGVQWDYGDVVSGNLYGEVNDYRVEMVHVKIAAGVETCDVRLESSNLF